MFFESYVPKNPICTDIQDKTQNDIYLEPPDFSEFQDPWENYYVQNNSIIYKTENNERQYYSVNSNSSPVSVLNDQFNYLKPVQQTHKSSLKYNRELQHNQQYNEPIFSLHTQYHQNQEQSNQFINKIEKRHSFSNSNDTTILNIQPNYFQLEHNIKKYIPVHNYIQNHHSKTKQQHINYEQTYQQSSNNNNKSLSEEIKHPHKLYNNHHDDHYQMLDNINNKQHHEQKNQTCDSLDVNIIHDQHYIMLNNITYQNNALIKQNIEQNENMNVTDKQTCTLISTSPHPDSKPCIDFHNVATQSDPHIMDDLNNSNKILFIFFKNHLLYCFSTCIVILNILLIYLVVFGTLLAALAGLAGALAQMTLGEPRSSEQIALEEHMRKQSWEQGQIDYMGRDSFDNIWKKICETLALAPPRLPSPPKEIRKSVKNKIDETDEFIKSAETTQFIKSTNEVDKRTAQTNSHTEEQSLVNNVPTTNVPKLLEDQKNEDDISRESQNDTFIDSPATNFSLQTSHEEITKHNTTELLNKISQQANVPIVSFDLNQSCSIGEQKIIISTKELENKLQQNKDLKIIIDNQMIHQMNQLDIRDEKYAKELLTASQILTVSPVPIQVAESVLQMELKESVLDSQIISQKALSSTITPIHLTETENKMHINDSKLQIENKEKLNLDNTINVKSIDAINKLSKLSIKPKQTSQISLTVKQIQPQFEEIEPTLSSNSFEISEKLMQKQTEQQRKSEYYIKETMKLNEIGSEYETNKILNKTPVKPLRIKELNSPSTSIKEIGQFDSISQKKLIKKIVKKSTEKSVSVGELVKANDGDTEKKVTKKIVKKKKLKSEEGIDDNTVDSNSFNKQKKTLKIVKKGIKSSQRTSTDTTVSEIPTSSISDLTSVPSKRKVKTIAAKSINTEKSDIEYITYRFDI
ncbi:Glycogenin-1 [Apis cerana cerana]|uniref:Glycogenin-1 n=1 Tax=Apis cerana cerana TaxID=94128 RepID=A0A2A3E7B0_APICC|nr:Glycogenin-1 [Apis cerana cerana]